MTWLANNWGTLVAIGVVALLIAGAIFALVRDKKRGKCSCGCNCSACAMKGACHKS